MASSETSSSNDAQCGPSHGDAVLLVQEGMQLPSDWRTSWLEAGWLIAENNEDVGGLAVRVEARTLIVSSIWPDDLDVATAPATKYAALERDLAPRLAESAPASATFGGGMLRRGDFLARLSALMNAPGNDDWVLLAIRVDQLTQLASLNALAMVALEEQVLARMMALLHDGDASTVWMELGFGVLIRRENRVEIEELARQLGSAVAEAPFQAADAPVSLTISIGIALLPGEKTADGGHRWFAIAHAAQAIAHRHGGNQFEGVLSRIYEPMPPERVLIVREWLEEAKTGSNVIIEFQPALPLHAGAAPLYMVQAKLRDYRAPLGGVYRDEFRLLASEAGALAMIDRLGLFTAFETLEQERARGRRTALLAPIDAATLDGTPWRWLQAELGRRKALADGLILELEASTQWQEGAVLERIGLLRAFGVQIGLSDRSGRLEEIQTWSTLPVDLLRLPSAGLDAMPPQDFLRRLASWKAQGRHVIVDGVAGSEAVARYAEYHVDYLSGQGLAAIGPRLDFDFG